MTELDSDMFLVLMLGIFWSLYVLAAVVARVSWIPTVPFFPLLFLAIGYSGNAVATPWGSITVGVIHLYFVHVAIKRAIQYRVIRKETSDSDVQ